MDLGHIYGRVYSDGIYDDSGPMYLLCDVFYTVPLGLYRSMFTYRFSILFHILYRMLGIYLWDLYAVYSGCVLSLVWQPLLGTFAERSWSGISGGLRRGDCALALLFIMGRRAKWYLFIYLGSHAFGNGIFIVWWFLFCERYDVIHYFSLTFSMVFGGSGPFHFVWFVLF